MLDESALMRGSLIVVGNINRDVKTSPISGGAAILSDGETAAESITETIGGGGEPASSWNLRRWPGMSSPIVSLRQVVARPTRLGSYWRMTLVRPALRFASPPKTVLDSEKFDAAMSIGSRKWLMR